MPESRAVMYTPAVTIVAAWMRALTGVGPAIASGSQTYNGICADLPVAPTNNRSVIAVATPAATCPVSAAWNTCSYCSEPTVAKIRNMPNVNPKSPTRLTMKAFLAALLLASFSNQKPISRYEHNPTPSQPTNIITYELPRTRMSIEVMNRLR